MPLHLDGLVTRVADNWSRWLGPPQPAAPPPRLTFGGEAGPWLDYGLRTFGGGLEAPARVFGGEPAAAPRTFGGDLGAVPRTFGGLGAPARVFGGERLPGPPPNLWPEPPKAAPTSSANMTPSGSSDGMSTPSSYSATTDLERAIDAATPDSNVRLALRVGALLEGGSLEGNWGVGDNGASHGPYQINQDAHAGEISVDDSYNPQRATAFMLPRYQAGVQRVEQESPGLFQRDPYAAAARAAYYAERPATMYAPQRVQWAGQQLAPRRQSVPTAASGGSVWGWTGGQRYAVTTNYDEEDPRFYQSNNNRHMGIDLATPAGTAVTAPIRGNVIFAGQSGGYGNLVVIDTGTHRVYLGHLGEITAQPGQVVGPGTVLARSGNSGVSTGPHLHFEVRDYQGRYVDPRRYYRLD